MTFDAVRCERLSLERGLTLGRPVHYRALTASTNDDALSAAREGAPHGALFVAGEQTAGRGRRGHRWFSRPGQSLTFTLLLRPALPAERVSGLALVAGLAVRAAVEARLRSASRSERPLVKWPNDVVVGGRKLCGILAESHVRSGEVAAVALGVGLNLGRGSVPDELVERAVSLAALGIECPDVEALVVDLLCELEARLTRFSGENTGLVEELREFDALLGRHVRVGEAFGVAAGISRSGSLLIRDEQGGLIEVSAGHVETRDDSP